MTIEMPQTAATLQRIDGTHWLIQDPTFPPSDSRHVVACLTEDDGEIDAVWVQPLPLPTRFLSAEAALDALSLWRANNARGTRPVFIPHLQPPVRRLRRRA